MDVHGADAHDRRELVSLLTGELRLGVVLFLVLSGYLLAGPWVASALDERRAPRLGRFAVKRAARWCPPTGSRCSGSFWLLSGTGHDYEVSAGQLPLFAAFGQNYVGAVAGKLDPPMWSLVVEVSFYAVLPLVGWLLVRAARRGRMVAACAGLAAVGVGWSAAGAALAWPQTAMSTLPTFLPVFACGLAAAALAHRRAPSPAAWWALLIAGALLVAADAWWHHQGTGMTGHVVRDLPAALGFAAVVAAVAAPPARGPVVRAPARPGHDLLRALPLAPAGAAVAAFRRPAAARRLRRRRGARLRRSAWWWRSRAGCSSSAPSIEAAGRWRPWTRRVPSFPADRHIRPVPSVA